MDFPRLRKDQYLSVLLLSVMFLLGGIRTQVSLAQIITPEEPVSLIQPEAIPVPDGANQPHISAQAAIVIDLPSASILYDKNARQYYYPASTAKLMTALIAQKEFSQGSTFTVTKEAYTNGTIVGFTPGMIITLPDLIKALLVHSGNDAAFLLANNYPGGYHEFVHSMNAKAKELHLEQTSYTNPSGLDETGQITTPFDLSLLAREILKDSFLGEVVASSSAIVSDQVSGQRFQLYTTNRLLTQDSRYRGVKTGTTELAGEVLVSRYVENERDFLIVVMASEDRYQDTQTLVDWVLANHTWQVVDSL